MNAQEGEAREGRGFGYGPPPMTEQQPAERPQEAEVLARVRSWTARDMEGLQLQHVTVQHTCQGWTWPPGDRPAARSPHNWQG